MKNLFKIFACVVCPWLVLFIHDDPIGALIAMIMQVTIVGWVPATIWAWKSYAKRGQPTPPKNSKNQDINVK